jgi:hypothetical protein
MSNGPRDSNELGSLNESQPASLDRRCVSLSGLREHLARRIDAQTCALGNTRNVSHGGDSNFVVIVDQFVR